MGSIRRVEAVLATMVIAAAVISRPVELRLWRARRLSDRAFTVLLLARFPAVCFLFGLILDVPILLVAGIALITSLTAVLFYGHALDTVRTQGRSSQSER